MSNATRPNTTNTTARTIAGADDTIEAYEIVWHNDITGALVVIGYAARRTFAGNLFSLNTPSGVDVVPSPETVAGVITYFIAYENAQIDRTATRYANLGNVADCPCCDGAFTGTDH